MARKARIRAQSGIYYVLLKSEVPFILDDDDAGGFLSVILKLKAADFIELYGYCLFPNEAHLVIKEGLKGISKNIMHIKSVYANNFNKRHNTCGKVFTGRFLSSPIQTPLQLLEGVRNVCRLPVKRGLTLDYEYCGYKDYLKKQELLSIDYVISLAGTKIDFELFIENKSKDEEGNLSDKELIEKIRQIFKGVRAEEIERLSDKEFKILIKRIIEKTGCTSGQIARVLNIGVDEIDD